MSHAVEVLVGYGLRNGVRVSEEQARLLTTDPADVDLSLAPHVRQRLMALLAEILALPGDDDAAAEAVSEAVSSATLAGRLLGEMVGSPAVTQPTVVTTTSVRVRRLWDVLTNDGQLTVGPPVDPTVTVTRARPHAPPVRWVETPRDRARRRLAATIAAVSSVGLVAAAVWLWILSA